MSGKFENLKQITHTFGEQNANLFLKAGWKLIDTEPAGNFIKYIFGWTSEGAPQWPQGITNPLKPFFDYIDGEIAKEEAKLKKKG